MPINTTTFSVGSEHSEQVIPPCKARAAKLNHFQEGLRRTVVSGLEDWLAGYAQAAPEARRYCRAVGLRHLRGVPVRRIHGQWADRERSRFSYESSSPSVPPPLPLPWSPCA